MAENLVSTRSGQRRRRQSGKKGKAKALAGEPTVSGSSQTDTPAANGPNTEAAASKDSGKKTLATPLGLNTVEKAKETAISITPSPLCDKGQSDGQPESSRARESHSVAPVGIDRASSKATKWTSKKGKKFVPMRLGSTRPLPLATDPGSATYVQKTTGTSSRGPSAATAKPAVIAPALPEKEFSEGHFPKLGSVRKGKRNSAKPSKWAPIRDPRRDEAERLALLNTEQQRAEEEGRLSWLKDPLNPVNGGYQPPSSAATPTHGAWAIAEGSTTLWPVDGRRARMFKAPYVFDENWKFRKPYQKQSSKLFLLATELLSTIFSRLDRKSRVKFARTSRASFTLVGMLLTVWDMTDGNFCNAEKGPMGSGSPTAVTVITEFSSPNTSVVRHEVNVLKTMTLSLSLWRSVFKTLEFHRAPLVTARLLGVVLPSLPNLEYLGVFACDLINVGDSLTLLGSIRDNVHVDFFPRRPVSLDVNIVSRIALPALLFKILPLAKKKNTRLVERGSAFAGYLRLVLPDIPRKQYEKIANKIQDAELTEIISSWKEGFGKRMYVDPKSNNARYWECTSCDFELRGCFFAKSQLKDNDSAVCWGCKLRDALAGEKYDKNFNGHRHAEVNNWLGNSYRLDEAVETIHKGCRARHAEKTFPELQTDDRTAKMARSKFWNPRFYQEAKAAWQRGEDPNDWWPDRQTSNRRNGRQAGRNRSGW
ncbi:hypothetical protein FGG08_002959 [Glutinoglossum americanum]|uniref:F-box domain-containing protein n=1 Tax=Glutinoglossum americanum TaxID=1670608 RepID=A0A9P8I8L3_9PEZI|nr:hypothetical protein FGG08_002959 [Glutinoglossum americanum]